MWNTDQKPSLVFFGTDEFAKIALDALKKANFNIVDDLPADLGVVASYGKILPKKILEQFRYGVLNIHPSLLPKYRGPSPIRTAIANGDAETGVTIIKLNEKMDEGPILVKSKYQISNDKKHSELRDELARLGAELLVKIIPDYIAGNIEVKPQCDADATYTKLITRADGKIDLHDDANQIYNKFRAYEGWPGIFTYQKSNLKNKNLRVKILDCRLENGKLKILTLQPEGKKPMGMLDYINGYGNPN